MAPHLRIFECDWLDFCMIGFGKRGLLEKGSFQKSSFSRDSREFRDSRDSREPPDCGKERRIRPFSRDSREFRDSRDSSGEKDPFRNDPLFRSRHERSRSSDGRQQTEKQILGRRSRIDLAVPAVLGTFECPEGPARHIDA